MRYRYLLALGAAIGLAPAGTILSGCGGADAAANPTPSPAPLTRITNQVLFVTDRAADQSARLWAMDPDGKNQQALSAQIVVASGGGAGVGRVAQVSRDGLHLLVTFPYFVNFNDGYFLYTLDGVRTEVGFSGGTHNDFDGVVAVNGDASLLAVGGAAFANKTPGIYTVRPDRSEETLRYALPAGTKVQYLTFGADDNTLWFTLPTTPSTAAPFTQPQTLYRLTLGEAAPTKIAELEGNVEAMRIRSDGGQIALLVRTGAGQPVGARFTLTPWTLNADGSGLSRAAGVTYTVDDSPGGSDPNAATIAYNGNQLLVFYRANSGDAAANDEIYCQSADGSGATRLTFDAARDSSPQTRARRRRPAAGLTGR